VGKIAGAAEEGGADANYGEDMILLDELLGIG